MARIYSRKKGKSGSKKPPIKIVPKWVKLKKEEIIKMVINMAKERKSSATIGAILRDQYGIPDVKTLTGKTITQIMAEGKLYPEIPEDLMNLFRKSVSLRNHLSRNKSDMHSKKGLEHMESKIRRLIKYYMREGKLPRDFRYDIEKVKLIIQK